MSADNRTTHTDAVATLGTILDETQHRDAIHLATEPVIAGHKLFPGQDVGLSDGVATSHATKMIGIVDPFLKNPIMPGERFWLIVYPRTITTLRHIWEHPDFDVQIVPTKQVAETDDLTKAIAFFAEQVRDEDYTYADLMQSLADAEGSDDIYVYSANGTGYIFPDQEYWDHYNVITGKSVSLDDYDDGCRGC